jgi:hypothetical protein
LVIKTHERGEEKIREIIFSGKKIERNPFTHLCVTHGVCSGKRINTVSARSAERV